jgi:thiamine-monophosphate kinase
VLAVPPGRSAAGVDSHKTSDPLAGQFPSLAAAHRRPEPPYAAGPVLAALGATAMIDVSDGLAQDLGHIARASGVRIELRGTVAFEN